MLSAIYHVRFFEYRPLCNFVVRPNIPSFHHSIEIRFVLKLSLLLWLWRRGVLLYIQAFNTRNNASATPHQSQGQNRHRPWNYMARTNWTINASREESWLLMGFVNQLKLKEQRNPMLAGFWLVLGHSGGAAFPSSCFIFEDI